MIQRGEHVRLALEARHALGIVAEPVRDDLDRHVATELRVARAIDLAHAPGADKREDLVGAKASAGCQGQKVRCSRIIPVGGDPPPEYRHGLSYPVLDAIR